MRVLKDPDVRRAEILDTAEALFTAKGYAKTTIVDILDAIGIAKGTFYYYFKSKEEVMEAVIARLVEADARRARRIADDPGLSPPEKFLLALQGQQPERDSGKGRMLEQFRQPANAEMRQRSLVLGVLSLAPVLTAIVEEGVARGDFHTPCPAEAVEVLMVSGQILFDEGMFVWEPAERAAKTSAFARIVETLLGAQAGSMAAVSGLLHEG